MDSQLPLQMRTLTCLLLFSVIWASCYEPKEGCLDISATNFNAAADEDCCCEYPKLILAVNQVYDTLPFKSDSLYPDDQGHLFRIKSVLFYLSEFSLTQNSVTYQVTDTINLKTYAGADTVRQRFTDDFQLVRRSPVTYTIGTFPQDGLFNNLIMRLGLPDKAQQVVPSQAPSSHPLGVQAENLWVNQTDGYVWLQAVVVRDSMSNTVPDTLRFTKADLGNKSYGFAAQLMHQTGYDFPVILTVDYQKMFKGINWSMHDISAWKNQINSNLNTTFSVSQ